LKSAQNAILFLQANKNLWTPLVELSASARNMKNFRTNRQPFTDTANSSYKQAKGDGQFIFGYQCFFNGTI